MQLQYRCIRDTMVLKAACTSAAEHVHTTGSVCFCSTSERNCPCQSEVLTRMIFSGSWSSEMRMWFSWSYTVFLGICSWLLVSGQRSLSRLLARSFWGRAACRSFRDVLRPRRPAGFDSDLVEGMTSDSVLMILPLGGSFSVNTSKVEVSASGLSSGCPGGSGGLAY